MGCVLTLVVVAGCLASTNAAPLEGGYQAVTAENPQISVDDLKLLLKPLRKSELAAEAEAWLKLLQDKVRQISLAEIAMREQGREISETKQEIKEQIAEIKENTKDATPGPGSAPVAPPEAAAKVEQEVQRKIATVEQQTEEIAKTAKAVTAAVVADINTADEKDVRASQKDILAKTEEVEQAKEKLKEAAAEASRSDLQVEEKVKKIGAARIELQAKVKEQLLANINRLREEQTALTDRFRAVMEAFKA